MKLVTPYYDVSLVKHHHGHDNLTINYLGRLHWEMVQLSETVPVPDHIPVPFLVQEQIDFLSISTRTQIPVVLPDRRFELEVMTDVLLPRNRIDLFVWRPNTARLILDTSFKNPKIATLDYYPDQEAYQEALNNWLDQIIALFNQYLPRFYQDQNDRAHPLDRAVMTLIGRQRGSLLPPAHFSRNEFRIQFNRIEGCCPDGVETWEGAKQHGATIKHVAAEFGFPRAAVARRLKAAKTLLALAA